jgi:hypothetical protein
MSCHRVRRALLWMSRFEEFGPDSQLHLDHLAGCRACRDEMGCDRALVRQLRAALAARVDGMEPSSAVWEQVRVLAQQPEPSRSRWPWRRAGNVMAIGRSLTAMAGTGLALVLALNTQIVTVTLPPTDAVPPSAHSNRVGVPSAWDRLPRLGTAADGSPAGDDRSMELNAQPDPEGLVVNVDAGQLLASITSPAVEAPPADEPPTGTLVVLRLPLAPEPPPAATQDDGTADDSGEAPNPSPLPAGAPT